MIPPLPHRPPHSLSLTLGRKQMTGKKQTSKSTPTTQSSTSASKKRSCEGVADDDPSAITKSARKVFFKEMTYPRRRSLPCVIKVDKHPTMGLEYDYPEPLHLYLEIERGFNGSPQMTLEFVDGEDFEDGHYASIHWGIDDILGGRWLMSGLTILSVAKNLSDEDVNVPKVADSFRESDGRIPEALTCMTIDVNHCQSKCMWDDEMELVSPWHKPTMRALFHSCLPHKIRIWFAIPFIFPEMETKCLDVLRTLFKERVMPFSKVEE